MDINDFLKSRCCDGKIRIDVDHDCYCETCNRLLSNEQYHEIHETIDIIKKAVDLRNKEIIEKLEKMIENYKQSVDYERIDPYDYGSLDVFNYVLDSMKG